MPYDKEAISAIIKKIIPEPKGSPKEFTNNLSNEKLIVGKPVINPTIITPKIAKPIKKAIRPPLKDTLSVFLK